MEEMYAALCMCMCRKDDIFRQRWLNHSGVGGGIAFRRVYPAQPVTTQWKTTFDGRRPLMEDGLWLKMTFDWRLPLMEDDLWWKTTFNGRRQRGLAHCWKAHGAGHIPLCGIFFIYIFLYCHIYLRCSKLTNVHKNYHININMNDQLNAIIRCPLNVNLNVHMIFLKNFILLCT